jgi:serine/threonine protein kinase
MGPDSSNDNLPDGCEIDQYTILKRIGGGGFSIVYLALDHQSRTTVVIKEFMPRKLAYRDEDGTITIRDELMREQFSHGRRLFFAEANFLADINHPNIVNVLSFFRGNSTAYMVMEYEKGITLQDYIKRHNNNLSEKLIRTVFAPILDGLKMVHEKGLLHLDIKPGNIYLRSGGNPLLLDFGAVHERQQTRQYQPAQVLTRGFCPYEQSMRGGYVGPWSDLYAFGATIRSCLDGQAPPSADERRMQDKMKPAVEQFKRDYSYNLLYAIDWAMEVEPTQRPQSVDDFLVAFNKPENAADAKARQSSLLDRLTNKLPWKR